MMFDFVCLHFGMLALSFICIWYILIVDSSLVTYCSDVKTSETFPFDRLGNFLRVQRIEKWL